MRFHLECIFKIENNINNKTIMDNIKEEEFYDSDDEKYLNDEDVDDEDAYGLDDEIISDTELEEKEEIEEDEEEDEEEIVIDKVIEKKKTKERKIKITIPILTIYERTQLISFRAQQIMNNSPVLVDVSKISNPTPLTIAEEELKQKVIPFKFKRNLPDNTYEIWDITEFKRL